jgi:CHAD domain-containing protein
MAIVKKRTKPAGRAVQQQAQPVADAPAANLVALAESIFSQTRHLLGLTKTSLRLVRAAAAIRSAPAGADDAKPLDKRLTKAQRAIVAEALAPHAPARVRPGAGPLRSAKQAVRSIGARIAAVLELAAAVAELSPAAQSVHVVDDGQSIAIRVPGATSSGAIPEKTAAVWQRLALRPIRCLAAVRDDAQAPPWLQPDLPMAEAGRRVLQRHLEHLLARQYGLPYAADLEYVHEMRVASRRLRAAIRVFRRSFRGRLKAQAKRLKELGDLLGQARDCDVFLDFLRVYNKKYPKSARWLKGLVRAEKDRRRESYRRLSEALSAQSCQRFLHRFHQALCVPTGGEEELIPSRKSLSKPVVLGAGKALGEGLADVLRHGRKLQALSSDEQHQLRIECKKLRYVAEFFVDFAPWVSEKLVDPIVRLQDALGKGHDADLYEERLTTYFRRRAARSAKSPRRTLAALHSRLGSRKNRYLRNAAEVWEAFRQPEQLQALVSSLATANE